MKKIKLVDPLPDKGELFIKVDIDTIMAIKESINLTLQHNLGDKDDKQRRKLLSELKDDLIELKDKLRPS